MSGTAGGVPEWVLGKNNQPRNTHQGGRAYELGLSPSLLPKRSTYSFGFRDQVRAAVPFLS